APGRSACPPGHSGSAATGARSFFFSSRRRHTRSLRDWSSDVCSSDLVGAPAEAGEETEEAVETQGQEEGGQEAAQGPGEARRQGEAEEGGKEASPLEILQRQCAGAPLGWLDHLLEALPRHVWHPSSESVNHEHAGGMSDRWRGRCAVARLLCSASRLRKSPGRDRGDAATERCGLEPRRSGGLHGRLRQGLADELRLGRPRAVWLAEAVRPVP